MEHVREQPPKDTLPGQSIDIQVENVDKQAEEIPPGPQIVDPGGVPQQVEKMQTEPSVDDSQGSALQSNANASETSSKPNEIIPPGRSADPGKSKKVAQISDNSESETSSQQVEHSSGESDVARKSRRRARNLPDSEGFITPRTRRTFNRRKRPPAPVPSESMLAAGSRKTTSPSPVRAGRSGRSRSPQARSLSTPNIRTLNQFTALVDEAADNYTQLVTASGNLIPDNLSTDSLEQEQGGGNTSPTLTN